MSARRNPLHERGRCDSSVEGSTSITVALGRGCYSSGTTVANYSTVFSKLDPYLPKCKESDAFSNLILFSTVLRCTIATRRTTFETAQGLKESVNEILAGTTIDYNVATLGLVFTL